MRALLLAGLVLLAACASPTDPNTAEYWIDRLDDNGERKEALKQIGKIGDKKAVPAVLEWLEKEGDWQPDAAYTLGQLGDARAVQPLLTTLDFQVGSGRDRKTRNKNRTNINVVRALAMLGAKDSAEQVIKLLDADEPTVREATIRSLGKLKNPVATERLIAIALGDKQPFLRKTAIQALGDLGDPKAVPTLIKMLYVEVPGISFYNEARFSLIQMGEPAIPLLIQTLKRKNKDVESIRLGGNETIGDGAIEAKAASVLGYLRAKKAEPLMIAALNRLFKRFKQRETRPVFASVPSAIIEISYALGNLGTPAAVTALLPVAAEDDAGVRLAAGEALTQIGDRSAVKTLMTAAATGDVETRRAALQAASRLGTGADLAAFDALAKIGGQGASKKAMAKMVQIERVRLLAAKQCKTDVACWRGKLGDANPKIRDKAVWELGWTDKKDVVPDLMKAAEDDVAVVRMAAVLSLARIGEADPDKLQEIYDTWAKKLDYQGVNQELLKLIARLRK